MNKKFVFGIILLLLFSTFNSKKNFTLNKFKVQEVVIKNNKFLKDQELIKDFSFLYNKNMIFLNSFDVKKRVNKNNFIKSLKIKKIYPNKLVINIFEKEPIAIIIYKQEKFYLDKKINLIEFKTIPEFKNLPVVYGDKENFKILFKNLKKINFPMDQIKIYNFFETKRWNIEMNNGQILKLPSQNYVKSLENYLEILANISFKKYKIFDYRLSNQLIMK